MRTHDPSLSRSRFNRRALLVGGGAAALSLAAPRLSLARYPTPRPYLHAEWLVDAAWVTKHLDSIKVVALTTPAEFEAGHIPGAAQIDWPALLIGRTTEESLARWQATVEMHLRELNITPADTVVIYDGGSFLAPRLWWALDVLGHRDMRILNGGLAAWTAANGPLETGASRVEPAADSYAGTLDRTRIMTQSEVIMSLGDASVVRIDARDRQEFSHGRIPGAANFHFLDNANGGAVRLWKSDDDLAAAYSALGVSQQKRVSVYCSTGTRACADYFTLRLIGYPDVRLYAGSWDEWISNPYAPRESGPAA